MSAYITAERALTSTGTPFQIVDLSLRLLLCFHKYCDWCSNSSNGDLWNVRNTRCDKNKTSFTIWLYLQVCQRVYFSQRQLVAAYLTTSDDVYGARNQGFSEQLASAGRYLPLSLLWWLYRKRQTFYGGLSVSFSVVHASIRSLKCQNGDATQQWRWCRTWAGGINSEEEVDGVGYKLRVSIAASRVAEKVVPDDQVFPDPGWQLQQPREQHDECKCIHIDRLVE